MPDTMDDDMGMSGRLTNDDFRKLLMTPRSSVPSSTPSSSSVPGTARDAAAKTAQTPIIGSGSRAELRRKKKSFYAKLKKQEEDKMAELAEKYRDRARERRDGGPGEFQSEDPMNNTNAYRAVAPDVKSGMDAAERRRQMIQQSKFLGGDMEHTHLVKGLDYALLQKVRSEIEAKETECEQEMEKLVKPKEKPKEEKPKPEKKNDETQFKTKIGRNIHKTIMIMKSKIIERNELFTPGRMAYVIELDDENAEADIPTTLIRSKADVPTIDTTPTLTTNDIVINKLAQILSYLRQGSRGKKTKKTKDGKTRTDDVDNDVPLRKPQDESIYGDIGDYQPNSSKKDTSSVIIRDKKKSSYFDKPEVSIDDDKLNTPQLPAILTAIAGASAGAKKGALLNKLAAEPEGYAECYPGLDEMQDAIDDSDDEVDYTKMDLGNKKGPIGRWDFDTPEEYSDYMNNKEALPKAAFQYGVKTADGRRTRKFNKEKNEKAELDREWQKIQNIMNKRKPSGSAGGGGGGAAGAGDGAPEFKVPRY
ncbi:protein Red [Aphidius gifuensis]|uniref:protein Red n=1 Tax=Aphidius gifuensis TaxID=684658 RepID=UPI001CDB69FA|nr:protein Red [Aphidius gifuensis]